MHPLELQAYMHMIGAKTEGYTPTKDEAVAHAANCRYLASVWAGWAAENEAKNARGEFTEQDFGRSMENDDDSESPQV